MQLIASLLIAYSLPTPHRASLRARPVYAVATAVPTTPASSDSPLQTLGEIVSCEDDLVVIAPAARAEAPVGALLELGGDGAVGVIVMERCGLYFAARLQGAAPAADAPARLLATNLSVAVPADGEWAGVRDYLARPLGGTSFAPLPSAEAADAVRVFDDAVPAPGRKPISTSLHTGVVAVDALTPLGRGQSCAVFGEKFHMEYAVKKRDMEIHNLEMETSESHGTFKIPKLKKVNKFKMMGDEEEAK